MAAKHYGILILSLELVLFILLLLLVPLNDRVFQVSLQPVSVGYPLGPPPPTSDDTIQSIIFTCAQKPTGGSA